MSKYQTLSAGSDGEGDYAQEHTSGGVPVVKLLLIGEERAGKSSLLWRWTSDLFDPVYEATLGMDFKVKNVYVTSSAQSSSGDNVTRKQWVRVQAWDCAGSAQFKNITQTYYLGAHGALVVFSLADRNSFNNVEKWICDFTSKADKGTPILLVGTKVDLAQERAVPPSLISDVCERYGCSLVETSTKTGAGVEEAFAEIARAMLETHQDRSEAQRKRATETQGSGAGSGRLDFDELIPRKRKKVFCCIPM